MSTPKPAIEANRIIVRGTDAIIPFSSITDVDEAEIDWSTMTAINFVVADKDGTVQLTKTLGSGIAVTGAGKGFDVTITEAETDALTDTDYFMECNAVDASSAKFPVLMPTSRLTVETSYL